MERKAIIGNKKHNFWSLGQWEKSRMLERGKLKRTFQCFFFRNMKGRGSCTGCSIHVGPLQNEKKTKRKTPNPLKKSSTNPEPSALG